jgi:hypothetical protein
MEKFEIDPSQIPSDSSPELRLWVSVLCTYITDSEWVHPDSMRGKVIVKSLADEWTASICDIVGIDVKRFRHNVMAKFIATKKRQPVYVPQYKSRRNYDII